MHLKLNVQASKQEKKKKCVVSDTYFDLLRELVKL